MEIPSGFLSLTTPFRQDLVQILREYPGTRWSKPSWFVPLELLEEVRSHASSGLFTIESSPLDTAALTLQYDLPDGLLPFQVEVAAKALSSLRKLLFLEMGLGKTVIAAAMINAYAKVDPECHFLVTCPKAVLPVWKRELAKWATGVEVELVHYEALGKCNGHTTGFLIVDEIHNAKNYSTALHKAISRIIATSTRVYGLTGTPVDKPQEIHSLVNLLWPGRLGTWGSLNREGFRERYCTTKLQEFGGREVVKVTGMRGDTAPELARRLSHMSIIKTREEHRELFNTATLRKLFIGNDTTAKYSGSGEEKWETHLSSTRSRRVEAAVEWAKNHPGGCLVTYNVETASSLQSALRDAAYVDGNSSPETRESTILEAQASGKFLICTMKSVGTGLDLSMFSDVLVVEMWWSLAVMRQLFGRFSRLLKRSSVMVDLLILEGSPDYYIATRLLEKLAAVSAATGEDTTPLSALFAQRDDTADAAALATAFETMEEEYWGE